MKQKFPNVGIVSYLWFDFAGKKNLPLFQSILFKPSDDVYNFLAMITKGDEFVMSTDYETYYLSKELGLEVVPCRVLGEAKGKYVVIATEVKRLLKNLED